MPGLLIAAIMGLALTCAEEANAAAPREAGQLAYGRYARVSGQPGAEEAARRVAVLMDHSVPRIAALVGASDLRPLPAVVYRDRRQFVAATGLPPQSPVVGLATFPPGIIHVDGAGRLASLEKVVPHEVAHVLIARVVGPALPALPRWLNEGIAEFVAGRRAAQVDPVTLAAVGRGQSLPLADLDESFGAGGEAGRLAYAESASLVNFLVDQRGTSVIPALLAALRQHRDFAPALQQTTGWTAAELEAAWRQSVARRWRWPLLLQSPALPFGLMLLLFIAGLLRYLRERRRRQERPDTNW